MRPFVYAVAGRVPRHISAAFFIQTGFIYFRSLTLSINRTYYLAIAARFVVIINLNQRAIFYDRYVCSIVIFVYVAVIQT